MQKPVAAGAPTLPVLTVKLPRARRPTFQKLRLARTPLGQGICWDVRQLLTTGRPDATNGMARHCMPNSAFFFAPSFAKKGKVQSKASSGTARLTMPGASSGLF